MKHSWICLFVLLAGCPTTPVLVPPPDGGLPRDSAVAPDAFSARDAAVTADAFAPRDANVDAPAPMSASDLVNAIAGVACNAAFDCAIADLAFSQAYLSMAHCQTAQRARFASLASDTHVAFDGAMATSCLVAMDASVCELGRIPEDTEWPAACRAALHGTIAAAASCTRTAECASGVCTCAGTCVSAVPVGADCSAAPCASGSSCSSTTPHVCVANTAPHALETCTTTCVGVLACISGTCRDQRFVRQARLGDACVNPFDGGSPSPSMLCDQNLFCDFDHGSVCAAEWVAAGPCVGQGFCPEGTACQGSPQACTPVHASGEACFDPSACGAGQLCNGSVCTALIALGDPCTDGALCFSGVCGAAGTCILPERRSCP